MSTSRRNQISVSKVIILFLMLLPGATTWAGEGTGAGNGNGGVLIALEPGTGAGNGNEGPVFPSSLNLSGPASILESEIRIVTLECRIKMDPAYRIEKRDQTRDAYRARKDSSDGTQKYLSTYGDTKAETALNRILSQVDGVLNCKKETKTFQNVENLPSERIQLSQGNIFPVANDSVVFNLAYIVVNDFKIYQVRDQDSPTAKALDSVFEELLADKPDNFDLSLPLSVDGGRISSRKIDTAKVKLLASFLEQADALAADQRDSALYLDAPRVFELNWREPSFAPIRKSRGSVSVSTRTPIQGLANHIMVSFNLPSQASTIVEEVNRWLKKFNHPDLILQISDRPTVVAYLSNLDNDLAVIRQFVDRVILPLSEGAENSVVIQQIISSIKETYRNRLAASLKAVVAMDKSISPSRLLEIDKTIEDEFLKSSYFTSAEISKWVKSRNCGEFSCPTLESDRDKLRDLSAGIRNAGIFLKGMLKPGAQAQTDSNILPEVGSQKAIVIMHHLAQLNNEFFIHADDIAVKPEYSAHAYIQEIMRAAQFVGSSTYGKEGAAAYLEQLVPNWRVRCATFTNDIEAQLASFKQPNAVQIEQDLKAFEVQKPKQ